MEISESETKNNVYKMKVAFNTYPFAFHTSGGGEVQLLKYKDYLQLKNVDITLFDMWNPNLSTFDLVHFFSCMGGSANFCSFIKEIGTPLVVSPNLWVTSDKINEYPFNEIREVFLLADKIVVNSEMECNLLSKVFSIPSVKFACVYNGIQDIFFSKVDPKTFRNHFGIHDRFVLNIGNIEPRKNQIMLAKAMKNFPELKLVIIGHERNLNYSKLLSEVAGDQLIKIPAIPQHLEIFRSAYVACEFFALPSTIETPSLAALEACAMGANVLITSEGSTREYFGGGVLYVNPGDINDISKGIKKVLTKPKNEMMSFIMRANFSWPKVTQNLYKVYENILIQDQSLITSNQSTYQLEWDGQRHFVWTKKEVTFKYPSGVLKLLWHSLDGAKVDVFVDSVLRFKEKEVPAHWTNFMIDLPHNNEQLYEITFIIKSKPVDTNEKKSKPVAANDNREIALAIADISFKQY